MKYPGSSCKGLRGGLNKHLGQLNARLVCRSTLRLLVTCQGQASCARKSVDVYRARGAGHISNCAASTCWPATATPNVNATSQLMRAATRRRRKMVRNVVFQRARGVFKGLSGWPRSPEGRAHGVQHVASVRRGRVAAKPEIEIFADSPVCAHGGSTSSDTITLHLFLSCMARKVSTENPPRSLLVQRLSPNETELDGTGEGVVRKRRNPYRDRACDHPWLRYYWKCSPLTNREGDPQD